MHFSRHFAAHASIFAGVAIMAICVGCASMERERSKSPIELAVSDDDCEDVLDETDEQHHIRLVSYAERQESSAETGLSDHTSSQVAALAAPDPDEFEQDYVSDDWSNEGTSAEQAEWNPDLATAPTWTDVRDLLLVEYRDVLELDADSCYLQAMASTKLDHMIQLERNLHRCMNTTKRNAKAKQIVDCLLRYRSEQERNRVARVALEQFYHLAELDVQRELLQRTDAQTKRLAAVAAGLKDSGIDAQFDLLGLQLQEIEVKRRFSELQKNEATLQVNLRRLIGMPPREPVRLHPVVTEEYSTDPGDLASLVETAFACRAELKAQDYLLSFSDDAALDSTRRQLRMTDIALGATIPGGHKTKLFSILFHGDDKLVELCFRTKQMRTLREETRNLIEVEVAAAYFAVCNRLQRLSLADEEARRRYAYVRRLEAARETSDYKYQSLADARLKLLIAESDRIHEFFALHIDLVKLHAAQGLYAE